MVDSDDSDFEEKRKNALKAAASTQHRPGMDGGEGESAAVVAAYLPWLQTVVAAVLYPRLRRAIRRALQWNPPQVDQCPPMTFELFRALESTHAALEGAPLPPSAGGLVRLDATFAPYLAGWTASKAQSNATSFLPNLLLKEEGQLTPAGEAQGVLHSTAAIVLFRQSIAELEHFQSLPRSVRGQAVVRFAADVMVEPVRQFAHAHAQRAVEVLAVAHAYERATTEDPTPANIPELGPFGCAAEELRAKHPDRAA